MCIRDSTAEINDIKAALTRFGPVETPAGRLQRITDIVNDLRAANTDLFFQAERIGDALVKADNIDGYSDADLFVFQSRGSNYEAAADRDNTITATATNRIRGFGPNHNPLFTGVSQYTTTATVNGVEIIGLSAISGTDAIFEAVEDAFEKGYNRGYDDGYDDGYNDGYKDCLLYTSPSPRD